MRKIIFGIIFLLVMASVYAETISYDDFECNGFGCGTGWNANWTMTGTIDITTLSAPQGIYMLRATGGGNATRNFDNTGYTATTISFWATSTSLETGDFCRYYYYNGATYTQVLQLADGQDTGTLQYYTYNITPTNSNAGVRVQAIGSTGDYCYIDTITTSGEISIPSLNIILDAQYPISKTNVKIDMTSTQVNTNYTLRLYDASNTLFCEKSIISPSVAQTIFSTYCNMPATTQTNARAVMLETSNPSNNVTRYFNVVDYQKDYGQLKIEQVYYSAQVLQGGQTEIFAVLTKNPTLTINKLYVELLFPDNTTRVLSMEPTINDNEYKALITDTYRVGMTGFTIRVESGIYYDEYTNNYVVAGYNVDFVEVVNKVAEVAICRKVEETPTKDFEIFGTEYIPGEKGTIFLQLKDDQGLAELDGDCHLDIFQPSSVNSSHPYLISDAPMLYNGNDDGIYYYDLNIPNNTGVYMLSASCSYSYGGAFVYSLGGTDTNYPTQTIITGTFGGSPIFLNDYEDWIYVSCSSGGGGTKYCDSYYDFNASTHFYLEDLFNVTNMNLYYMGENSITALARFMVWNWDTSTWINLTNTLTYSGGSTAPLGIGDFASNSIPINNTISSTGIIRIRVEVSSGTNFKVFHNWLNIKILTKQGTIQDLKGSSEIHVSELYNNLNNGIGEIPLNVWNYTTRNLTYYEDVTNYSRINDSIIVSANNVINNLTTQISFVNNNLVSINGTLYQKIDAINTSINTNIDFTRNNLTARIDLLESTLSSIMYALNNSIITQILAVPLNVWTHTFRNLTYYEHVDMTNYTLIAENQYNYTSRFDSIDAGIYNLSTQLYAVNDSIITAIGNLPMNVWTYTTRNLTYYAPATVDVDAVGSAVWNYTTRNLTYYENFTVLQVDMTNYTEVAVNVWTYITRNLTYYPPGLTAQEVWEYSNRNLTYYENFTQPQIDLTNYTDIYDGVWNYMNRNLTYYPPAFVNTTEVAIAVWDYNTRNLTYYPAQMDMTNYSLIGAYVWNETDRNLTYYPAQVDLTNYTAINEGVWTYTTRNLTYYEHTDMTNYTQIPILVWTYTTRNLTYYPEVSNLTAQEVWEYSNRNLTYYQNFTEPQVDLTNYTLINNGVWAYNNRNLTYYPPQTDLTNYSKISNLTAQEVWNYTVRDLTYYQINNITPEDVWTYINRTLTYYEVNNMSASDVWTYNNRTLTYYPSAFVNTTEVAEATWNYTARYTHGELITG